MDPFTLILIAILICVYLADDDDGGFTDTMTVCR